MISSITDVKIFIEHHKSTNMVVNKERFQNYDDNQLNDGTIKQRSGSMGQASAYNQANLSGA